MPCSAISMSGLFGKKLNSLQTLGAGILILSYTNDQL